MGSNQSARKLTISNEEEVGMIKISNAVIQRLAQGAAASEPVSDVKSNKPIQHSTSSSPNVATVAPQTADSTTPGYPVYYYPELTMSAYQMQQQMEQEQKEQDKYWQKRLQNLEKNYEKINNILEDEYKKAASEASVAKTEEKLIDIQSTMQPCLENSNKIIKCFQDHPKETLKCSNLVEEFSNCVWKGHYARVIEARS